MEIAPAGITGSRVICADERRAFDEQGFLHVPGAIPAHLLDQLHAAVDDVYDTSRGSHASSLHLLGFLGRSAVFLELLDLATTFPLVWGLLGWNIHAYHSHLDVHPPAGDHEPRGWGWHQDGGRQNLEVETEPRPRLSVKVAFWLSDVSEPGRGNTLVLPGSHRRNALPRTDDPLVRPPGAIELLARPGDAVIFDRRLWHSRSPNRSPLTRKALFIAYTYRWIRPRDDHGIAPDSPLWESTTPLRRQLLGAGADPESFWGLGEDRAPLREMLSGRGVLDSTVPNQR